MDPCGTTNILIGDGGNAGSVSDGYADGAHSGKCPGALATVSVTLRSTRVYLRSILVCSKGLLLWRKQLCVQHKSSPALPPLSNVFL